MTRRHDALIPLTHDHHHALHNVRILKQAADGDADTRRNGARDFTDFFRGHSVQHFREEEEEIFPRVARHAGAPMDGIVRVVTEHVRLHALVMELEEQQDGEVDAALMLELAELLRTHIRFEEDELFPAIEALIPAELDAVKLPERPPR